jgi:hypothetical protein
LPIGTLQYAGNRFLNLGVFYHPCLRLARNDVHELVRNIDHLPHLLPFQ